MRSTILDMAIRYVIQANSKTRTAPKLIAMVVPISRLCTPASQFLVFMSTGVTTFHALIFANMPWEGMAYTTGVRYIANWSSKAVARDTSAYNRLTGDNRHPIAVPISTKENIPIGNRRIDQLGTTPNHSTTGTNTISLIPALNSVFHIPERIKASLGKLIFVSKVFEAATSCIGA
jgi:hypothetical protein